MRLRQIEVFFAIWRSGSVTAAAEELAISQSSVSKTLKHAEQSLGFELFHRVRGKLVLSEEGEILLNDAARIFESLDQMRGRAAGLRNGLARSVRVVCLPSLGQWLIPQSVVKFHAEFPKVAMEITTKHEGEMLEGVRAREYDLAFAFGPADDPPHFSGLTSEKVTEGQLVYIESGRGGWAAPVTLAEINYATLINLSGRHFLGNALREELAERGLPERSNILVQTYSVARELIANGLGSCIVDEFTAITRPINVRIRPLRPKIRFGIHLYHREGVVLSRHERAFLEMVREAAATARRH
ncbi:LysR family transcriptional regulator [Yangia mangrovi]|uniref:LysR family transcriptional regulator n=1 Tax=Alloyangia mangrovi TaxID=1779329 RepID=A0A2A3JY56_9RHOB|nr:LysR family transcriptional regulator [Alloyangia mangrovi]MCA0942718.1 LysR family transcriptional regulator [Alloyangia pacifica]MCA0946277.1 LysR family transcriptional regulator [Alloyangia pacifica]MCT4368886.1 LysR family transcriptional regulator [Alloyangia mangrovi]